MAIDSSGNWSANPNVEYTCPKCGFKAFGNEYEKHSCSSIMNTREIIERLDKIEAKLAEMEK